MPDMMAIVSKAVFEKSAPKAKLGVVLGMRSYRSASRHLEKLDKKSRLFLVTVRPPDESLWLVAMLEGPEFDDEKWLAARNRCPVTDISSLKSELRFESGKGIVAAKGALGMSLQTPRVLTAADSARLLERVNASLSSRAAVPRPYNLTAHEAVGPLPCLCKRCLEAAPESVTTAGTRYLRTKVEVLDRVLWFWLPADLESELPSLMRDIAARLGQKLKPLPAPRPRPKIV